MKIKATLTPLFYLVGSFCWAGGSAGPKDIALLKKAFEPPSFAYQGHLTITHWYGPHTKTEDVNVFFKPPNSYRWEFLKPDGHVNRVHVRNGDTELIYLPGQKTTLTGKASKSSPKNISADREWDLLNENYQISKFGSESVAGKTTTVIELLPKTEGKQKQQFWIGQESGMVLAIKRFQEGGRLVVHSRFTQFQKNPSISNNKFLRTNDAPAETEGHGYDQNFKSLAEFEKQVGKRSVLPNTLPMGFEFESADSFESDSHRIHHYRYTDGMAILSIFETSKPSRFLKSASKSARLAASETVGPFQTTDTGHVLHRKLGDRYLTLVSDLSEDALETIGQSLK